jgi:hypothetical protein
MIHAAQTTENIKVDVNLLKKEIEELDNLKKQKKDELKHLNKMLKIIQAMSGQANQ